MALERYQSGLQFSRSSESTYEEYTRITNDFQYRRVEVVRTNGTKSSVTAFGRTVKIGVNDNLTWAEASGGNCGTKVTHNGTQSESYCPAGGSGSKVRAEAGNEHVCAEAKHDDEGCTIL